MKYLLMLILISSSVFAMEPIVKVEALPADEALEAYEDSEELFVVKVMQYYTNAVMYKAQLESFNIKPDEKVVAPTLEEINDMELDVIIKYYNLARSLEGQIESTNYVTVKSQIYVLKDSINRIQERFMDSLWNVRNSYLQRELAVKNERDSISNDRVKDIEDMLSKGCRDCKNFFSVDVSQNVFFPSESDVSTTPNVGVRLALNASKVLGFGKSFKLWYEYQAPRIETQYTMMDDTEINDRWNSHLSAMGVSTSFYPLIASEKINNGIKLGVGYFWAEGTIYNREFGAYYWEGAKLDIEYFVGVNSSKFPFELFVSGSLYQTLSNEYELAVAYEPDSEDFNIGRSLFKLNLGLRYNFWSTSFK